MKPSKPLLKALKIIATFERGNLYHEIWPKMFALLMWPDSPCWKKSYNTGPNGATRGKGMWLCAGSYLNKLEMRGLVCRRLTDNCQWIYGITQKGYEILRESLEVPNGQVDK